MQGQSEVNVSSEHRGGLRRDVNGSTLAVIGFLITVSVHRVWEGFRPRPTVAGQRQMNWSFHVFFMLHVAITGGAFIEYVLLRRSLIWSISAIGLVLFVISLFLRAAAIRTLGKYWSLHVEIRSQHELVREGVYNWIRHPAYAAIVLEVLCIPMVANAWWTMFFAAVIYLPLLGWRLRTEERALTEKFGEAYRIYQGEVGGLIPKCSSIRKFVGETLRTIV